MNGFSKLGFILAALGSSIGLGQIWRFPYMTAQNGGGAFVVIFLAFLLTIGISVLIAEMVIGNTARENPVKSFQLLDTSKSKKWYIAGFSLFFGLGILLFYSVILGWVAYYMFYVSFDLPSSIKQANDVFNSLAGYLYSPQLLGFLFIVALTGFVIAQGVQKGIEKLNFFLMPLLFIIFIGLVIYASTFDSFGASLSYLFTFKFEDISLKTFSDAMGQVFFSLSLGIGIIITYAASSPKEQNLFSGSLTIAISGLIIALMAGIMIFAFVFDFIPDKQNMNDYALAGPGLVFKTLPVVFNNMGFVGHIVSILFFLSLGFAGITSTISLLEPGVMYIAEKFKAKRSVVTFMLSSIIFIIGFLVLTIEIKGIKILNLSAWDWLDFLVANIGLLAGGLAATIFVGWVIKKQDLMQYCKHSMSNPKIFEAWYFFIKYISPIVILAILISSIIDKIQVMFP